MDLKTPPRENQEKQNRNKNVRRPQVIQNKKQNPPGPHVRPTFQENLVNQDGDTTTFRPKIRRQYCWIFDTSLSHVQHYDFF